MAKKRMFSPLIICSDAFSDMGHGAQLLYIKLNMAADDDGFIGNPRRIMRADGFTDEDMKALITSKFVLVLKAGEISVILIKHWRMQNTLRPDRYTPSPYHDLLRNVYYDENKAYSLNPGDGHTHVIPSGNQTATNGCQDDIPSGNPGKVRLGKVRLGEERLGTDNNNSLSFEEEKEEKSEAEPEWKTRAIESCKRLGIYHEEG